MTDLSAAQARRIALAAQGFHRPPSERSGRPPPPAAGVRADQRRPTRLGERARAQPGAAAVRPPRAHSRTMLADAIDDGELWEYWAHMAAIVPSTQHRLFRWRMDADHAEVGWSASRTVRSPASSTRCWPASATAVRSPPPTSSSASARRVVVGLGRRQPRARAPVPPRPHRRRSGGRRDFAREYDLPERVLPASVLDAPTPTEAEARKELLVIAARSMGVATLDDLADYHRQWNQKLVQAARRRAGGGGGAAARHRRGVGQAGLPPSRRQAPSIRRRPGAAQPVRLAGLVPPAHRAAVRLPLPDRDLRTGAQARLRLLRAAVPAR